LKISVLLNIVIPFLRTVFMHNVSASHHGIPNKWLHHSRDLIYRPSDPQPGVDSDLRCLLRSDIPKYLLQSGMFQVSCTTYIVKLFINDKKKPIPTVGKKYFL
jgi:hypothetical protein